MGVPKPDISWYFNGKLVRETDKYHIKRDGDACCLYIKDCTANDSGVIKCVAKNKEGEASIEATLEVVEKM